MPSKFELKDVSAVQAQVALLLDGMAVFDRTIKVSMARGGAGPGVVRSNDPDRAQRAVHVGGLPMEELSETVLADFFQNVGEVTRQSCVQHARWLCLQLATHCSC